MDDVARSPDPSPNAHVPQGTARRRLVRAAAALLAAVALGGCEWGSTAPPEGPPYIAILPRVGAIPQFELPTTVTYRVRQLSAPATFDQTFTVAPRDTLLVGSLPIGTYEVTSSGWPDRCFFRDSGPTQRVALFDGGRAWLVRYQLVCQPSLTIFPMLEGQRVAPQIVQLRVIGPDGRQQWRSVRMSDTVVVDNLPAGEHRVGYSVLPANCFQVFPGGSPTAPIDVRAGGGTELTIRIHCADVSRAPRILAMETSRADGFVGAYVTAVDPDRNLDRYFWNVTDCRGRTLLRNGERTRTGLLNPFGLSADTTVLTFAFEPTEVEPAILAEACLAVRFMDRDGNSTPIVEKPIRASDAARAPLVTTFNARFVTTAQLEVTLNATDPDDDYVGNFLSFVYVDGTINGRLDGQLDLGIFNATGQRSMEFPIFPMGGGRPTFDRYVEVRVALLDRRGNLTIARDRNFFE